MAMPFKQPPHRPEGLGLVHGQHMAFIDANFDDADVEVSGAAAALQTSNETNSTEQFVPSSITSAKELKFDGIIDAAANLQLAVYGNTNNFHRFEGWDDLGFGYSVQLN